MQRTLTLFFILFPFSLILSQSACPNIGFENGNFNGWEGSYGCNPRNIQDYEIYYTNNACGDNVLPPLGFTLELPFANIPNNLVGQQAIIENTWNGGVDPYIPALSLTPPSGGNFVARIGDYYNGARAGELTHTLTVDSSNALLTAFYAIVLEAPGVGHTDEQNPYFRVRLIDPDGNSVPCVEYIQDGVVGAEGFNNYDCGGPCISSADGNATDKTVLVWRDWTAISVNLLPYIGQDITIIFEAGDCGLSGHLGYTYIDLSCQPNQLLAQTNFICKGVTANLSGPPGMDSYEWHYGDSLGPIVGTTQNITVMDTGLYYCTLTPFSSAAQSCPFTLPIYVEPAPSDPEALFDWDPKPACIGQDISFIDESTTEDDSPLVFWQWTFDDGSPTSNQQNPVHAYDSAGTYDVELIIESVDGCRDTIVQAVEVIPLEKPVITPPDLICSEDDAFNLMATPTGGTWSGIGIIDTVTGSFDPVLAYNTQSGPYTIRYEVGKCGEFTELDLDITLQRHADFPPDGPFCNDTLSIQFNATEQGGVWEGTGIDANGLFSPMNAEIGDNLIKYAFYGDCGDSTEQTIVVNPRKDATITPIADVCLLEDPVQLKVVDEDGIWEGNGISSTGVFNPETAGIGTHQIIYYFDTPCPDADTISITVIENKDPNFNGFGPLCESADSVIIIPDETGGTWSGNGVDASGVFRPNIAGAGKWLITYRFAEQCGGAHAEQIEVLEQADASFTGPTVLCPKDDPVRFKAENRGGTWGGSGIDQTGLFDPENAPVNQNVVISYIIDGPCPDTVYHTIFIKDFFNSTITPVGPYCEDDAAITLTAVDAGGIWSGNGILDANAGTFDPSAAGPGMHTITYDIAGNCGTSSTTNIEVIRRPIPSINPIDPLCSDGNEISFVTQETGGIWSGDAASNGTFDPKNFSPGTYKAYYSFTGQCSSIDSINIIITQPITITDSSINLSCNNSGNGEIFTKVTGGWTSSPYNYAWEKDGITRPEQSTFLQNLSAGNYTVTVSDLYACTSSHQISITEPNPLIFDLQTDSSNCMQANGSAAVTNLTGGTAPYTFSWSNGVSTAMNNNIVAGVYFVDVTDANNCVTRKSIEVFDISGPTATIDTNTVSCFSGNDGSASVINISNGEAPYNINWSTNLYPSSSTHSNLAAGAYSVTITDAIGCQSTIPFDIDEPTQLTIRVDNDTLLCVAQDVTLMAYANGGTPNYTYYWDNQGPQSNAYLVNTATSPEVYALDANGCKSNTETINVTYRAPLNIDVLPNDTTICAGQGVNLRSVFGGGTGNYTFTWDDGNTNNTRPYLPQGNFGDTITIGLTLSDNCSPDVYDTAIITFFEPAQPNFEAIPAEGCEPLRVDFIDLSVNVSNLNWNLGDGTFQQGQGDFTHTYLKGLYTITMDAVSPDGCKATLTEIDYIKSYGNPIADFTWQPKKLTLLNDQIHFLDRSSGDINMWNWEFYSLDSVLLTNSTEENPLIKTPGIIGNHLAYLHVTTINGCVDSIWHTYEIEPDLTVYVPNTFTPNGDRVNEGWKAIVRGIKIEDYSLSVYNRWGEVVWSTTNPEEFWDGSYYKNPIEIVKTDVYVWRLELRDFKSIKHVYTGHLNILK